MIRMAICFAIRRATAEQGRVNEQFAPPTASGLATVSVSTRLWCTKRGLT